MEEAKEKKAQRKTKDSDQIIKDAEFPTPAPSMVSYSECREDETYTETSIYGKSESRQKRREKRRQMQSKVWRKLHGLPVSNLKCYIEWNRDIYLERKSRYHLTRLSTMRWCRVAMTFSDGPGIILRGCPQCDGVELQ